MPALYSPLPNPHTDPNAQNEMEAAFLDSDDEDDEPQRPNPTVNTRNGYQSLATADPSPRSPTSPATYDFEAVDNDWARPPPGSPPPSALSFGAQILGNTNGFIPDFSSVAQGARRQTGGWLRSTARAVLPARVAERLGVVRNAPGGIVGGGSSNDGVFANVTAKPTRPVRIIEGDNTYLVPEESQKDAPPSYASAQADAVPPYWETTIHAPSSSSIPGEMIIDALPTGSLFSFLWNMLVSISFQFVGFLLTYLLHTTHAAKLGSRAGLGVTLIQYGFAMRGRYEDWGEPDRTDLWAPRPTFETAAEAEEYYKTHNVTNSALDSPPPAAEGSGLFGDATTEWLSFLLMTIGWFILLTSVLSFWRVKRWERGIMNSTPSSLPAPTTSPNTPMTPGSAFSHIRFPTLFRQGLGFPLPPFPGAANRDHGDDERDDPLQDLPNEYIIPINPNDPDATSRITRAYVDEARLHHDLRAAGLL